MYDNCTVAKLIDSTLVSEPSFERNCFPQAKRERALLLSRINACDETQHSSARCFLSRQRPNTNAYDGVLSDAALLLPNEINVVVLWRLVKFAVACRLS